MKQRFDGQYAPYEDGKNSGVFIRDPRNSSRLLTGEVSSGIILDVFIYNK